MCVCACLFYLCKLKHVFQKQFYIHQISKMWTETAADGSALLRSKYIDLNVTTGDIIARSRNNGIPNKTIYLSNVALLACDPPRPLEDQVALVVAGVRDAYACDVLRWAVYEIGNDVPVLQWNGAHAPSNNCRIFRHVKSAAAVGSVEYILDIECSCCVPMEVIAKSGSLLSVLSGVDLASVKVQSDPLPIFVEKTTTTTLSPVEPPAASPPQFPPVQIDDSGGSPTVVDVVHTAPSVNYVRLLILGACVLLVPPFVVCCTSEQCRAGMFRVKDA